MPQPQIRLALLVCALLAIAGCSGGSTTSTAPPATPSNLAITEAASATPTDSADAASAAPTDSVDAAVAACFARPRDLPDVIVRTKVPTLPYSAQLLGGNFTYNHRTNECQSAPDFDLAGTADQPGYCVQVAEASDNPGYNPDAQPAPPLEKVIASKGSC